MAAALKPDFWPGRDDAGHRVGRRRPSDGDVKREVGISPAMGDHPPAGKKF